MRRTLYLALIGTALANVASANNLGPLSGPGWNASAFNVVSLGVLAGNSYGEPALAGNLTSQSDIGGGIAVYGNVYSSGPYNDVATNPANPYTDAFTSIVNGTISTQNPLQNYGNLYDGGGYTQAAPQALNGGTVSTTGLDFNFSAARTALENYSANVLTAASLNPINYTSAPSCGGGSCVINLSSYSGVVVVDLNPAYLTTGNGLNIQYNTSTVTSLVINVIGSGATTINTNSQSVQFNGQTFGLNAGPVPILFNFPTTQVLNTNDLLTASVLAPFATLDATSNISGNIIVGQLNSTAELHGDYFSGTGLPAITATPEPVSFALVGAGLVVLAAISKRFRR